MMLLLFRGIKRIASCALPAATFGTTCRYLGRAVGYLRPGPNRFGTAEPPVFAELMETTAAS